MGVLQRLEYLLILFRDLDRRGAHTNHYVTRGNQLADIQFGGILESFGTVMQKNRLEVVHTRAPALAGSSHDRLCVGRKEIGPKAVSFRVQVLVDILGAVFIEERTHGSTHSRRSQEAWERACG